MDLGAYAQIEDLEKIMKENGIYVPRLRGLRLMKDEKPISKEDIEHQAKETGLYYCECAIAGEFKYDPPWTMWDRNTDRLKRKYIVYKKDEEGYESPVDIRWDLIHGYKRKLFKYRLKQARKQNFAMWNVFNKYCGRDDVLYVHARIGGGNWSYYGKEVKDKPWFIEKVDDAFDSTYCDIYAKINK